MALVESESTSAARSISGAEIHFTQEIDRTFFVGLVEFLWPADRWKQAYELHLRTGATERMCRNWLAGSHPPSALAVIVVVGEVVRRLN